MKKMILWSSCVLLFLLSTACKQNETISLLSMHTWVVTSTSLGGVAGDEYKLYDNRLFMHSQAGYVVNDGYWNFDAYYNSYNTSEGNEIRVDSDLGEIYYVIKSVTNAELKLTPIDMNNSGWGTVAYFPTITLTPK